MAMTSGGVRRGAGRKRKLKSPYDPKVRMHNVLNKLGKKYRGYVLPAYLDGRHLPTEDDLWLSLLLSEDKRIRLDTLRYLKNRAEGEPSHQVNHTVQHLIAMEEGRQLARKMLELKNRKTLELTTSRSDPREPSESEPSAETKSEVAKDETVGTAGDS